MSITINVSSDPLIRKNQLVSRYGLFYDCFLFFVTYNVSIGRNRKYLSICFKNTRDYLTL